MDDDYDYNLVDKNKNNADNIDNVYCINEEKGS